MHAHTFSLSLIRYHKVSLPRSVYLFVCLFVAYTWDLARVSREYPESIQRVSREYSFKLAAANTVALVFSSFFHSQYNSQSHFHLQSHVLSHIAPCVFLFCPLLPPRTHAFRRASAMRSWLRGMWTQRILFSSGMARARFFRYEHDEIHPEEPFFVF